MGLARLTILVEKAGAQYEFGSANDDSAVAAMFNPSALTLSRTVQWKSQSAAKRDNPEMQYTGGDPISLSIDLLFDTYDTPEVSKKSVRTYTDKLLYLTTVEQHGDKHRPPLCRLQWGDNHVFFQGVLQKLDTSFTLFLESGIPVRATCKCAFKQWIGNDSDLRKQDLVSSDVAKIWIVKRGELLPHIAAQEYGDPRQWRLIAEANQIEDPLALQPGMRLLLPAKRVVWNPRARG
jgi:nucleoid-associated protein YgaU